MKWLTEKEAFVSGWRVGSFYGAEFTFREAENYLLGAHETVPSVTVIDAFCQGTIDGKIGDAYRLNCKH